MVFTMSTKSKIISNSNYTYSLLLLLLLYLAARLLMMSLQFRGNILGSMKCGDLGIEPIPPVGEMPRPPSGLGVKHPMGGVNAGCGGVPWNETGVLVRAEVCDFGEAEGDGVLTWLTGGTWSVCVLVFSAPLWARLSGDSQFLLESALESGERGSSLT